MRFKLPRLIGLHGLAGAGKDTVADYLVRQHRFVKRPLAAPIKAALNTMFGWLPEDWEDREWKEARAPELGNRSPRYLAQTLGTEWGRDLVVDDLWLRLMEREWNHVLAMSSDVGMVVPDVRFVNEAERIRQLGGMVVRIVRPNGPKVEAHSSEAGLPDSAVDMTVLNDSTPIMLLRNFCAEVEDAYAVRLADRDYPNF